MTAEHRKPVVHVDHDASSSRPEQPVNVISALLRCAQAVTVSKGIHTKDEVNGTRYVVHIPTCGHRQLGGQSLVPRDLKSHILAESRRQKRTCVSPCGLDESR